MATNEKEWKAEVSGPHDTWRWGRYQIHYYEREYPADRWHEAYTYEIECASTREKAERHAAKTIARWRAERDANNNRTTVT